MRHHPPTHLESSLPRADLSARRLAIFTSNHSSLVPTCMHAHTQFCFGFCKPNFACAPVVMPSYHALQPVLGTCKLQSYPSAHHHCSKSMLQEMLQATMCKTANSVQPSNKGCKPALCSMCLPRNAALDASMIPPCSPHPVVMRLMLDSFPHTGLLRRPHLLGHRLEV